MPELPEVETVVRQLDKVLSGRVVENIEVLREKSAQSDLCVVMGKKIMQVTRKQKMIVVEFEESELKLLAHLKMTGQLIYQQLEVGSRESGERVVGGHPTSDWVSELPSKHTRIMVNFNDGSKLFFNDQRVFGWMKVVDRGGWENIVNRLPPDVVDEAFTKEYLSDVLGRSGRAVKLVILDQQKMGGMGNIYANDALWLSRVHPERSAREVDESETLLLHEAMVKVLRRAIELGGSSYSDFVDTDGLGGGYQNEFLVYDQEDKKCQRNECGGVIAKVKIGGRGSYYCPVCQV